MEPLTTLEELMWKHFPEQTWLVEGLIPSSAITILSGPPASYKTSVLLDTALAITQGRPLFGHYKTDKTNVLVVDEESGERLLQQRMFQLSATADMPIYFYSLKGFRLNEDSVEQLILRCQNHDIRLVIFDSLVRIHSLDENSAGDMAEVFKYLRRLAAASITVIITHHNRKPGMVRSGANEMRGSSDILASVDCHIALSRNDSTLTFQQTKQRYARELKPFEVLVEDSDDNIAFSYVGDVKPKVDREKILQDAIVALLSSGEKMFQKQILTTLSERGVKTNEHKLRQVLLEMVADGRIIETAGAGKTKYYSLSGEDSNE